MQGDQSKALKTVARGKGWEPDAIVDPSTGKSIALDAALAADAEIFVNQGVPMTSGKYGPPMLNSSSIMAEMEGPVTFAHPTPRNDENNARVPGMKGDPYAGKSVGGK